MEGTRGYPPFRSNRRVIEAGVVKASAPNKFTPISFFSGNGTCMIMQISRLIHILIVLVAAVLLAGCTSTVDKVSPPASPTIRPDLLQLTLTSADVPSDYTLIESKPRDLGDKANLAKDLGWQGGYVTHFIAHENRTGEDTDIVQSIAVYPPGNLPGLVTMVDKQEQADPDMPWTELNTTGLGNLSRGFYGKALAPILVKPTNVNPLSTDPWNHDVQTIRQKDTAEIIFAQGNILEVIKMTGPRTDPAILREIARTQTYTPSSTKPMSTKAAPRNKLNASPTDVTAAGFTDSAVALGSGVKVAATTVAVTAGSPGEDGIGVSVSILE